MKRFCLFLICFLLVGCSAASEETSIIKKEESVKHAADQQLSEAKNYSSVIKSHDVFLSLYMSIREGDVVGVKLMTDNIPDSLVDYYEKALLNSELGSVNLNTEFEFERVLKDAYEDILSQAGIEVVEEEVAVVEEVTETTEDIEESSEVEESSEQEEVADHEHSFVLEIWVNETCDEDGYARYVCTQCNHSFTELLKKQSCVVETPVETPEESTYTPEYSSEQQEQTTQPEEVIPEPENTTQPEENNPEPEQGEEVSSETIEE